MYIAIAAGLNSVRKLVPESELVTQLTEMYSRDPNLDYYYSIYRYSQKDYEQFKSTKSLSGMSDLKTNTIMFDFDSKSDLNAARQDAVTLVKRLNDKGLDNSKINIYHSGLKGFNVELITDQYFTQSEANSIRQSLAGDLDTNDTSISDVQRIIRAPLSKHNKSGLYKIPLTADELSNLSVKQIAQSAKELRDEHYDTVDQNVNKRIKLPIDILKLKDLKESKKKVEVPEVVGDKPDFSRNKTGLTNAKYALSEGFFEEGERNEATMILASTYMGLGFHKELAYNSLKATYRLRALRLGLPLDTEDRGKLWDCIEHVYSPLWKGGMYSEDTNALLIKTKKRYSIEDKFKETTIVNIGELKTATESFLKNLKDNRIYTGLESLDKNLILTKGMLFGVLGCPGSGKTSFLNVFAENTSKNHGPVLYFSMDMSKDLLGTKIIQRYTGYSLEKLEDMMLHGTYDKTYLEAVEKFSEDYKKVGFCFENGHDVHKISDEIERYQDKIGQRVSMVAVDYLEKVVGPYSDATANSGYVASNLANLAKKHDTCIGLLLQPNKLAGSPADELTSYRSIKGASLIEQDARAIVGIYRPGYSPEDFMYDKYMSISILKQNMGKLGRFDYMWDGSRGHMSEMSTEQRRLFKQFIEELKEKNKKDDDI